MRAALRFLARGLVGAIVAGIAIARTADAQVLPTWTVQREMTIDSLTDGRIIVDSAGRIYAEQIVAHNVRVYSPKGVLLRTLDGYYNRPPEWKVGVSGMGLVGDSLWVETGNDRLFVFPMNGKKPRTATLPKFDAPKDANWGAASWDNRQITSRIMRALLPGGRYLISIAKIVPEAEAFVYVAPKKPPTLVARGHVIENGIQVITRASKDGRDIDSWCWVRVPFANYARDDVSDDGSAVVFVRAILDGDSAGFARVTMLRPTGDTVYSRRVPASLVPIPERVRDSVFAPENLRGCSGMDLVWPGANLAVAEVKRNVPRAMYYPPVQTVDLGRDGWLLIGFAPHPDAREHLLVDPTGTPAARIVLPRRTVPVHVDRDHIWAVEPDANNTHSIVRYRIVRTSR